MSVDINWEEATSGSDGDALAEQIRSFVHDKFQQVPLPRFIRSVEVTSFDFGNVSPEIEIRDICDPFSDFYEEDEEDGLSERSDETSPKQNTNTESHTPMRDTWHRDDHSTVGTRMRDGYQGRRLSTYSEDEPTSLPHLRSPIGFGESLHSPLFPRSGTPGIPGGTSNLGYYYMPLSGLSGTQTPLTHATRGPFTEGWPGSVADIQTQARRGSRQHSDIEIDSLQSRPSTSGTMPSVISDLDSHHPSRTTKTNGEAVAENLDPSSALPPQPEDFTPRKMRERRPDDLQVFCRIKYAGNIKLSLTAQILLDYPMPSFVGLPLELNITGLTFDGVAVFAYIRRRAHLCFLPPEDANALLGDEEGGETPNAQGRSSSSGDYSSRRREGSLLRDLRVESEIGRKENGKQVLKNVGKVERFVLEQVRRIFEEEFVYPSFWTFLV